MYTIQQKKQFIADNIRNIIDYPKPGILFRDITTLLENAASFQLTIDLLAEHYQHHQFHKIAAIEARGFIFAAPLALILNCGLVTVRKANKLPYKVISQEYQLEYGSSCLEIHTDAIKPGEKVLIIDDLLATGGTVLATTKLVRQLGGIVNDAAFVINLFNLGGATYLKHAEINCFSLLELPGH